MTRDSRAVVWFNRTVLAVLSVLGLAFEVRRRRNEHASSRELPASGIRAERAELTSEPR